MTDEKKPQLRGFNSKRLTLRVSAFNLSWCEYDRWWNNYNIISSSVYSPVQVRLFRAGKKTSRQSKLIPPIADRLPRVERIKTDIILTCILGVVLFINNLRYIRPKGTGVNYYLKNLKAS